MKFFASFALVTCLILFFGTKILEAVHGTLEHKISLSSFPEDVEENALQAERTLENITAQEISEEVCESMATLIFAYTEAHTYFSEIYIDRDRALHFRAHIIPNILMFSIYCKESSMNSSIEALQHST